MPSSYCPFDGDIESGDIVVEDVVDIEEGIGKLGLYCKEVGVKVS